jgi:hypothetical protein
VTLAASVESSSMAISPDGKTLAFIGWMTNAAPRVYLRPLASPEARAVPGTERARTVFFSPDGRSIGFFTPAKLNVLGLESGAAVVPLADVRPGMGYSASWGADGKIAYIPVQGDAVVCVSTSGGAPETLVKLDPARGEARLNWPLYLPDGKSLLYLAHHGDGRNELMLHQPGRAPRVVGPSDSAVQLLGDDLLLFTREGTLLAQRFDAASVRLSGAPFAVAPSVAYFYSNGWAAVAASRSGVLVIHSGKDRRRVYPYDRAGRRGSPLGEASATLRLSRDGKELFFDRLRDGFGTPDIWRVELERGSETRVTTSPDAETAPVGLAGGRFAPRARGSSRRSPTSSRRSAARRSSIRRPRASRAPRASRRTAAGWRSSPPSPALRTSTSLRTRAPAARCASRAPRWRTSAGPGRAARSST